MRLVFPVFLAAFLCKVQVLLAEVTVLKGVQVIYDKSPKLRIRGTGFDVDEHDINLEIGAQGQPSLIVDQDFKVTKYSDEDGIILKLLGNRKWVDLTNRSPPVAIVLNAVKFASNPDKNLLAEAVIVAQILLAPSINENKDFLYQTASNELCIDGTGLIGAKNVDLYFQPPFKEVAYEDITSYPLQNNQVILRLRNGYQWRETPGPLFVIGVDTGGGPIKVDGYTGVKVAEVIDNHDLHAVAVEPTANKQLVYADDSDISITGTGFNVIGNQLRFANGLLGNNVNYTTMSTSETTIKLRLTPGSHWLENMADLPGALSLVAVNAGAGFIAVGPVNTGKGCDVAMVFERPEVYSYQKKIFRTHSHELHISGSGFPSLESGYKVALRFKPDLKEGLDYSVRIADRTEFELTLLDGRSWRADAGPLVVTHINTRGDINGWVELPGMGVQVANVVEDIPATKATKTLPHEMRVK